jgi:hypothetical protein
VVVRYTERMLWTVDTAGRIENGRLRT